MEIVMRHEARQVPSWLIFDVRQRMKSDDPFGIPSTKRLLAYACVGGVILIGGCVLALHQGTPAWRVVLLAGLVAAICGGVIGAAIWFSRGPRSEVPVGRAQVRPPVRMMKALPYVLGLMVLLYLVKLAETFSSR